uniref:Uncharacterized protein n=1 Tax=Anguilla anguilla TaxID=7936 RepID=A0A0E9PG91_ANGAN
MCLFTFLGPVLVPQENAIVELPAVIGHCSPPIMNPSSKSSRSTV